MKTKNACSPKRRGSALIFATIILFSLLAITVTLSAITVSDMKMSQKTKSTTGAFYNADSGVEWALYKITNSDSSVKINSLPGVSFNPDGSAQCPFGGCNVFFLKSDGTVITQAQAGSLYVSDIKAVRSVGTQGAETQRAIEAAVAATGGGCYIDYSLASGLAVGSLCKVSGFTVKGSAGKWGRCGGSDSYTTYYDRAAYFNPPGGACPSAWGFKDLGEAYVCCM